MYTVYKEGAGGIKYFKSLVSGICRKPWKKTQVKIFPREDSFQTNIRAFYPAGESAGYAGGIRSSAVDGFRVAEPLIRRVGVSPLGTVSGRLKIQVDVKKVSVESNDRGEKTNLLGW